MTYQKLMIPIDHGNRNMKTEQSIFTSGLVESKRRPALGEYLFYHDRYYALTEQRIPYMRDKTMDERFFILTLFAIAMEAEKKRISNDGILQVELPVGLPPKHFGALYKKFGEYFMNRGEQQFTYKGTPYRVQIEDVAVFPQDYAAAMTVYPQIREFNKVLTVDIGGFTLDYFLIRGGKPDLSVCESLEMGIITLYNKVISRISSEYDILLEETDVDSIIRQEKTDYPNGYDPLPGSQIADNTEVLQQIPETQTPQTEYDTSPVYYSSLAFADGELNAEALSLSENADILPFDETILSQDGCCMIIEGTIVNLYVKHYDYDVYYDKFDKNDTMHMQAITVVYEIAVDKTWYGEDVSGQTITVEDTTYFTEPVLAVKTGIRYVLPLFEYGESIWTLGHEYAGGDITRESRYSTIYPYHPQIAVTEDGSYFIPKDWSTLTAVNARDVIMDTLDEEHSYYQDKMCLVDADTFASQMSVLVSNLK